MARLRFTKMHGIGNDYVYVDCFRETVEDAPALAVRVSPRHTGIGSDGLILIRPSDTADCRMEMYNADGSRGDMCGNGIRCVGKYVYDHGIARKDTLRIDTDAGIKVLQMVASDGIATAATVDMGPPILDGERIPVKMGGRVINEGLIVDERKYRVTCISMGNPHCVIFANDVEGLDLRVMGPCFENHPFFPNRVNTEFVKVLSRNELRMRVWERGSGETAACGTGACAVLVAAALNDLADRAATIHLNGGDLQIEWRDDNHVFMTGPATEVYQGEIEI